MLRITDLPNEILLLIVDNLHDDFPARTAEGSVNSFAQTCRTFRRIAYPIANRSLIFDEEDYWPTMLIDMVIYSFTDPLAEYVKILSLRLRQESGYWLRDEYEDRMAPKWEKLKELLKQRAGFEDEFAEVFAFFETQIELYGEATLATILLFQLPHLTEIELSASITATSSKFMTTVLHLFDPPCKRTLNKVGIVRLVDLEGINYWLLERFLRFNIRALGIDQRFASSGALPKLKPRHCINFTCAEGQAEVSQDIVQEGVGGIVGVTDEVVGETSAVEEPTLTKEAGVEAPVRAAELVASTPQGPVNAPSRDWEQDENPGWPPAAQFLELPFAEGEGTEEHEDEDEDDGGDSDSTGSIAGESEENDSNGLFDWPWSRRYAFSEYSAEPDFEEFVAFRKRCIDLDDELADHGGYQLGDYDRQKRIDYELVKLTDADSGRTDEVKTLSIEELVLWLDEIILDSDYLIPLLEPILGLKKITVKYFPSSGFWS
ncbi:hypothetical protein ABW19_dt0203307 [Dactylella cylindrospora]|nr:hypothetical protein ABW19_dt0203307 [Dactylella cylindrospora]